MSTPPSKTPPGPEFHVGDIVYPEEYSTEDVFPHPQEPTDPDALVLNRKAVAAALTLGTSLALLVALAWTAWTFFL